MKAPELQFQEINNTVVFTCSFDALEIQNDEAYRYFLTFYDKFVEIASQELVNTTSGTFSPSESSVDHAVFTYGEEVLVLFFLFICLLSRTILADCKRLTIVTFDPI